MMAALTTLIFLAAAWLAAVAMAQTFEENRAHIAAAIFGRSLAASPPVIEIARSTRPACPPARALRPQPALRAAA